MIKEKEKLHKIGRSGACLSFVPYFLIDANDQMIQYSLETFDSNKTMHNLHNLLPDNVLIKLRERRQVNHQ